MTTSCAQDREGIPRWPNTDRLFLACHGGIGLRLENGLPAKLHLLSSLKKVSRLYFPNSLTSEYFALEVNLNGEAVYLVFHYSSFDWIIQALETGFEKTRGQMLFGAYRGEAYNRFTLSARVLFSAVKLNLDPHIAALLQNDRDQKED